MRFNPVARYVPGKEQVVSDVLSRKLAVFRAADGELSHKVEAHVDLVQSGWPASPSKLQEIRHASEMDHELREVVSFVVLGWSHQQEMFHPRTAPTIKSSMHSLLWTVC